MSLVTNSTYMLVELVVIEQLMVGADGKVQASPVRVTNDDRSSTLCRPFQHLYPKRFARSNCRRKWNDDQSAQQELLLLDQTFSQAILIELGIVYEHVLAPQNYNTPQKLINLQ